MTLFQIAILALVQGAAELLPVSSSAHVIIAQKMMGLDPGAPELTFLLVMLHTGTMFAVLVTFASRWKTYLKAQPILKNDFLKHVVLATGVTGVLGLGLKIGIEKGLGHEVEHLFRNLPMIAFFLALAGVIILTSGLYTRNKTLNQPLTSKSAAWIGAIQGLCLPFRGFSRSGVTISAALFQKIPRLLAEDFSFALAVAVTPPVIFLEFKRLIKAHHAGEAVFSDSLSHALTMGFTGMIFSFVSGYIALKLLARALERRHWQWFGIYCFFASSVVLWVHHAFP